MKRIGTSVFLKLHEAEAIPTLLNGCETWTLDSKEIKLLERIELWALKRMFGLPPTTPTAGVRYTTGTYFTEVRIQIKQLIYLQSLLQKENDQLVKDALMTLDDMNDGWAKYIKKVMATWEINKGWDEIAAMHKNAWKLEVMRAAEIRNKELLSQECQTRRRGVSKTKTKTKTIIEAMESPSFKRQPLPILKRLKCIEARALIMGRYGMLDCKANFSMGYGGKMCNECDVEDNENHRLNDCPKYSSINRYDNPDKIDFNKIYSDETDDVMHVVSAILDIWDLENGKNKMKVV